MAVDVYYRPSPLGCRFNAWIDGEEFEGWRPTRRWAHSAVHRLVRRHHHGRLDHA